MIGDDLRAALGLPLVVPPKLKLACYPSRYKHTHQAYVYPNPRRRDMLIVRWYYHGVAKSKVWWIRRDEATTIAQLRRRLQRFEPTIFIHPDARK